MIKLIKRLFKRKPEPLKYKWIGNVGEAFYCTLWRLDLVPGHRTNLQNYLITRYSLDGKVQWPD